MLNDLKGKDATITLEFSAMGNFELTGKILDVSEDWVKIQSKNSIELIAKSTIKKVSYKL